ncbi:MAG: Na+/H+ antiporter NhaA [Actinobacteria bacterium]|nr:Na+/H+ antiporter NhaA [Actinomycetota bacterium]
MRRRISSQLRKFFALESAGGIFLVLAALIALIIANSPAANDFNNVIDPFHGFINEGLMAIFFFMVGLEIRNEIRHGEMRNPKNAALPIFAAIGGMLIPALIYTIFNYGGPGQSGWAVPMPTDIALAIGALALLGSRIDTSLKIFLLTLAIVDDLFSIVILGVFYTSGLSPVKIFSTIGVVAIALLMPEIKRVPTKRLIEILHPWTAFLIIPLFALTNIGVEINWSSLAQTLSGPVAGGIIFGRVVGKIIGITLFAWLAVKIGFARKPDSISFSEIAGAGALAGMGLTVSLFLAELAINDQAVISEIKLGLVAAALISAILGILLLRRFSKAQD